MTNKVINIQKRLTEKWIDELDWSIDRALDKLTKREIFDDGRARIDEAYNRIHELEEENLKLRDRLYNYNKKFPPL